MGAYSGHVRRIAFRSTHIETFDRHEVIIPNSDLISGSVTNLTYGGSLGRVTLPLGIAYDSDIEAARSLLLKVVTDNARVLDKPEPSVVLDSLGDSAINLKVMCFVENVNQRLSVRSDLYFAILKALDQAGIIIPLPQRDPPMKGRHELRYAIHCRRSLPVGQPSRSGRRSGRQGQFPDRIHSRG